MAKPISEKHFHDQVGKLIISAHEKETRSETIVGSLSNHLMHYFFEMINEEDKGEKANHFHHLMLQLMMFYLHYHHDVSWPQLLDILKHAKKKFDPYLLVETAMKNEKKIKEEIGIDEGS